MGKSIVQLKVEVHVPDDVLSPAEREAAVLEVLRSMTGDLNGSLFVVQHNSFMEPLPDPPAPDPTPPLPPTEFGTD